MSSNIFQFNKSFKNPNKIEKKFYGAWLEMKRRCSGRLLLSKKNYIERGITVCNRWERFDHFFIDMWDSYLLHIKMFKKDTSLDRINNDKGYYKSNCRWSTKKEQQNNRTNTIMIKGKSLVDWSKELKVDRRTLYARLFTYKYPIDKALSRELFKSGRKSQVSLLVN